MSHISQNRKCRKHVFCFMTNNAVTRNLMYFYKWETFCAFCFLLKHSSLPMRKKIIRGPNRRILRKIIVIPRCERSAKLESSQSSHTSAKAMLFARWQHHLRFCSSFPYAPLKAMVTKISKWSRIQDSFRITPKIELLVVFVIPDMPSKFRKNPSITFWVILLTHRQTDRQNPAKT